MQAIRDAESSGFFSIGVSDSLLDRANQILNDAIHRATRRRASGDHPEEVHVTNNFQVTNTGTNCALEKPGYT